MTAVQVKVCPWEGCHEPPKSKRTLYCATHYPLYAKKRARDNDRQRANAAQQYNVAGNYARCSQALRAARLSLAQSRAEGLRFEEAWRDACAAARLRLPSAQEVTECMVALRYAEAEWRAAYEERPSKMRHFSGLTFGDESTERYDYTVLS